MPDLSTICDFLGRLAPLELAESWDNVGLLVGDPQRPVARAMTCLTITPASADEAVAERADLVVTHHPLPFQPLVRLTTETTPGRLLLKLIGAGVAVYSAHTAFDSAEAGINQRLAEGIGLTGIGPLVPFLAEGSDSPTPGSLGSGRVGNLADAATLADVAQRLKSFLGLDGVRAVGSPDRPVARVAVACGSAGQFVTAARDADCEALVTGETSFHTCLEAEALGVALLLAGHYASERFAQEYLAAALAEAFPDVTVWASRRECDPLRWL